MRSFRFYIILIFFLFTILFSVLIYFYNSISYGDVELMCTVPKSNALAVLRFKSLSNSERDFADSTSAQKEFFNNDIFGDYLSLYNDFEVLLKGAPDSVFLDSFKQRSFIVSSHLGVDFHPTLLTVFKIRNRFEKRSIIAALNYGNRLAQLADYEGCPVYQIKYCDKVFPLYFTFNGGLMSLSYSRKLIEQSIVQQGDSDNLLGQSPFTRLLNVSRNSDSDNLFLNFTLLAANKELEICAQSICALGSMDLGKSWGGYDVDFKGNQLTFTGILVSDCSSSLIRFLGNGAGVLSLDKVYPARTNSFINYSFKSEKFPSSFLSFIHSMAYNDSMFVCLKGLSSKEIGGLFDKIGGFIDSEFGMGFLGSEFSAKDNPILFVKISNTIKLTEAFDSLNKVFNLGFEVDEVVKFDSESRLDILKGLPAPLMWHLFGSFFPEVPSKYMFVIDGYWVVSDNKDLLKRVFQDFLLSNTLSNNVVFKQQRNNFPANENVFLYSLPKKNCNIHNSLSIGKSPVISKSIVGIQLTVNDSITYSSVVIDYSGVSTHKESYKWKSHLDSIIAINPCQLVHPQTNEKFLLIQDAKNVLYLLNSIGRIIWKRPLEERIISNIIQLWRNERAENGVVFNTQSKLYHLNFDGNNIVNFPVLLPSRASCGLSLFDYEKNGDFRIFIPSIDKEIRVYDKRGNLVVGFQSRSFEGAISNSIQHFSVGGKDYIIISDGLSTAILDRKGNDRIVIKAPFEQNLDSRFFYLHEEKSDFFVTSSSNGDVVKIAIPTGEVSLIHGIAGNNKHHFFAIEIAKNRIGYLFVTKDQILLLNQDGSLIFSHEISVESLSNVQVRCTNSKEYFLQYLDSSKSQVHLISLPSGAVVSGFPKSGEFGCLFEFDSIDSFSCFTGSIDNSIISY